MSRLYCITREDLTFGQKAAQLCHAATQYLIDHPDTEWDNGFIICLQVKDLKELSDLEEKMRGSSKKFSRFVEPDMENELTSISAVDCGKSFANLKLLR